LRGRVGGLIRRNAPPEKIDAARADLKAASLRDRVKRDVSTWPPLSAETRAELAILLLNPGNGDAG